MNHEESMYWRAGSSDEPLEEEREAMTSEEIKASPIENTGENELTWLREIAYQLAVANERAAQQPTFVFPAHPNTPIASEAPELQRGQNT